MEVPKIPETSGPIEHDPFLSYLRLKGLSQRTLKEYGRFYAKLQDILREFPLDQEVLDTFITYNKGNVVRAMVKNFLDFEKRRDLEVRKRTGRVAKKKTEIMSDDALTKILDKMYQKNFKYGLIVNLCFACAMRVDEVLNIRAGDFDWEGRRADPTAPVRLLIKKGKGNKERYVMLPQYLIETIRSYAVENNLAPEDKLFFSTRQENEDVKDKHLCYFNLAHSFQDAVMELGYINYDEQGKPKPKYHLHSLRHYQSTKWYEQGLDIIRIQQRLGHSSIATTRLYINPDEKQELQRWKDELR